QPKGEQAPVRKQIEDAIKKQEDAIKKLEKEQKEGAAEDQDKAVEELKKAKQKLEDLLKQIREEEIERLLAALQNRCEDMLRLQRVVNDGTFTIFTAGKSTDGKLDRTLTQRSTDLAISEDEIIKICATASRLVEEEGSAIAFAEVFKQV